MVQDQGQLPQTNISIVTFPWVLFSTALTPIPLRGGCCDHEDSIIGELVVVFYVI